MSDLFTGTAKYYAKYRAGYPKEFFDFVTDKFQLDGTGRLLDLGCGTGQIFIPLAESFERIVALDPEPEMLNQAELEAKRKSISNVDYVKKSAENISVEDGTFRLTTLGSSFHWMKQTEVLEKIYSVTEINGGVVVVSDSSSPWRDEITESWKEIRKNVVRKYLGPKRRAGSGSYEESKERFEDLLSDSSFAGYEEWTFDYERTLSLDGAINFLYSTSFASKNLFGDKLDEFEAELKEELKTSHPEEVFSEQVRVGALVSVKN